MNTLSLPYTIYLSDPIAVANAQATYPAGITASPATASALFNAPIQVGGAVLVPPSIQLNGLDGPGTFLGSANLSAVCRAGFTVTSRNIQVLSSGAYASLVQWNGIILMQGVAPAPGAQTLSVRRFGTGFEIPNALGAVAGTVTNTVYTGSRSASRRANGRGYAYRNESGIAVTGTLPAGKASSWVGFFFCLRFYSSGGTNHDSFWQALSMVQGTGNPPLNLHLDSQGHPKLYNQGSIAFPGTLLGTGPRIPLNTWARVDLLFYFSGVGAGTGMATLYVNGVKAFQTTVVTGSQGLGIATNHISSIFGQDGGSYNGLELDIDDWTNADYPVTLAGLDWLYGSHYQRSQATGFNTSFGLPTGWVGDWRSMNANPVNSETDSSDNLNSLTLTSSAAASICLNTDYQDLNLGCTFMRVMVATKTTTVAASQACGRICAGVQDQRASGVWASPVTGGTWAEQIFDAATIHSMAVSPPLLYPVQLVYTASATTTQKMALVGAEAEFLGTWGIEDETPAMGLPAHLYYPPLNVHNAPYADQSWAQTPSLTPTGAVQVLAGTYTGNGTGQSIAVGAPLHWWWVRPVGTVTPGGMWFSSLGSSHTALAERPAPQKGGVHWYVDSTGTAQVEVAGSNTSINANGVVYQWVGVSDTAMRFLINGYMAHKTGLAGPITRARK